MKKNRRFAINLFGLFFLLIATQLYGQSAMNWKAKWIVPGFAEDSMHGPCPVFRRELVLRQAVRSARLYITAHGLYEASVNDRRVGRDWFTPGYTSYHKRLQYQVYNIDTLLHQGRNQLEVTVGDGWYRGKFGADLKNNRYGKEAGLLFQLELLYADGSRDTIVSDESWLSGTGRIRYSDLYTGERADLRMSSGFWSGVGVVNEPMNNLIASVSEPVRQQERFQPVRQFTTPKGEKILDFGQNMAGWVVTTIEGRVGDSLSLSYAETLDSAGNFFTGNLRLAEARDVYILKGGRQVLEPHFTYHGFRYVKLEGGGTALRMAQFTAVALYSDLGPTGSFACSDTLLNRLQNNINWSQNSNFFDIPTDCPQRSERFGWTGDAQIFCRTASFNRNVKAFFTNWLADLAAEQGTNGGLPVIVPDYRNPDNTGTRRGVAGWGDAATIIPWTLYEVYGDTAVLKQQYSSMKAWVDYIHEMAGKTEGLWKAGGYGDWYAPLGPTDSAFIDQVFYFHSTQLLVKTARVLGKSEDVAVYSRLLEEIRAVFLRNYTGLSFPNTQTAYVLALQFGLLPDSLRASAARQLVGLIHANKEHLSTGFLGTPYLLFVLGEYGYTDVAYTLLKQTSPPSWLYPLTKGATTIWEKWAAIKPDGGFDTCSLNHYAYGAVGDWLYRVVAGIDAGAPGYKKIIIHPHPGGGLDWVRSSYKCPYGTIVSNWKLSGDKLEVEVEIPAGTSATVVLPQDKSEETHELGPGQYHWSVHFTR